MGQIAASQVHREDSDHTMALLAAIVASSDDAIVSKSLEGIINSWNQGAERLFGYTAEEAVGRSILLIIPEDRRAEETMILARILAGQQLSRGDRRIVHPHPVARHHVPCAND